MSYTIVPLFAVPLYQSTIPAIDKATYEKLINFHYEEVEGDVTHHETSERFILHRPEFAHIKKVVDAKIAEYVHEVLGINKTLSWELTTSWVNMSKPGQWHASHWHSNSLVSGVFYLHTNQKSGAICFHKSAGSKGVFGDTFGIEYDKDTDYNTEAIGVLPMTHTLFMFPSTLAHSVLENESNENRYSLAFNVFPRGTIGKGGNSELTI